MTYSDPAFTPKQNALLAQMNFDESKVWAYELPDCLTGVSASADWSARRQELLHLFETHVYGKQLPVESVDAEICEESNQAWNGRAIRRQVTLRCAEQVLNLIIYIPKEFSAPVPCFVGLNFCGNHAAFLDREIRLSTRWILAVRPGVHNHRATEQSRGMDTAAWPLDLILRRGFALATMYYGDIEPDHEGGFAESIRSHFLASKRQDDDAGAITAWSWGLSRMLDYLETVPEINAGHCCLVGHSRLGKAALWASACDSRFALVIANNSGCAGGALSRRNFGETLYILSNVRPYWFCKNCVEHSSDIDTIPVDQHTLIALCAPRPLMLSCAEDDLAADPRGEFLALEAAKSVYQLLQPDRPDLLEYRLRLGGHNLTLDDWNARIDFAERQLQYLLP